MHRQGSSSCPVYATIVWGKADEKMRGIAILMKKKNAKKDKAEAVGRMMTEEEPRYPLDFSDLQATKYGDAYLQYSRSKLMNHMTALKMAREKADGVTVNVLEPGVIETKLLKRGGYSGGPVKEGSVAPVHLVTSNELKNITGEYFNNRGKKISSSADAMNTTLQDRLWKMSEEICAKFGITF